MAKKKNWFLRLRDLIENRWNNTVKQKTRTDIFDWALLGLWIMVSLLGVFAYRATSTDNQMSLSDLLTFELLWFTAFVLVRYTKETYYLKKLAQAQNITSIRPYLRLQWQTTDNLVLVNEGKGVAVALKPRYEAGGVIKELLHITAMAAAPNSSTTSFIPPGFTIPNPEKTNYEIKIRYQDIESRRYVAIFRSSADNNDKFLIVKQREG